MVARLVVSIDAIARVGAIGVVVAWRGEVGVVNTVANLGWRTVGVGQMGCRWNCTGCGESRCGFDGFS
jgi:hypothetical protein